MRKNRIDMLKCKGGQYTLSRSKMSTRGRKLQNKNKIDKTIYTQSVTPELNV